MAGDASGVEGQAAEADAAAAEDAPWRPEGDQPPISADEERPVPDYDGREDPTTAGDVLIWIPRGLFYPVYLVSEYLIRWPLGKLTVALDQNDIPSIVGDFFTFGPGDKMGVVPSFLLDFGFRPSVGVYFFTDDLPVDGLGFRTHLAYGGNGFYRATGSVLYDFEREGYQTYLKRLQLKGIYSHRPDWLFYGIGPETFEEDGGRYTAQYIEGVLSYTGGFWRSSRIDAWAGIRDASFVPRGCCDDRSIIGGVFEGFYDLPPGFAEGYLVSRVGFDFSFDTRERLNQYEGPASDHVNPTGTGLKVAPRGELGIGLTETAAPSDPDGATRPMWVRYGGTLGGFLDLYNQRVLGLQMILDFVDPLRSDGQIPFTELISLGGSRPMRGFLQNRLLGRSSAVAQLSYRWPIWIWLDGAVHYEVGNVFGERLEGFDPRLFRQSFDFGFAASGARDHTFELLLGFGTETFDQGGDVDAFRFVFGSTAGF